MDATVDLDRARREAKALLRAARAGDPDAVARIGTADPQLSDAQLAIARELGARSWPALVRRVEADAAAREEYAAALALGDLARVQAELADDPDAARRQIGRRRWVSLLHVTYSEHLGRERTDRLVACARALLAAGADPNAGWEDAEVERMTALNGAAGVAHEPRMTALLLQAGADPDDGRCLRMAAGDDDPACLELLLDAGATVQRSMALAHAAERDALACARVLLDGGPRDWGESENALVWAVRGEASPEMLALLVEHGADLEASFDGSGRTPYAYAIRAGRRDLADLLASLGAQRRAEPLDELLGACLAGDVAAAREGGRRLRRAAAPRTRRSGPPRAAAPRTRRRRPPRAAGPPRSRRNAELAWAAESAHLRLLASIPLAETRPVGNGFAVVTGIEDNTENGVVADEADEAAVREAFAFLAERDAPARWLIGPDSSLSEGLIAAGASPERTGVVMGAQLDRLMLGEAPLGVTIVALRDAAGLVDWREVAGAALFDDAEQRARLAESLGLGEDAPVQHRLALRDGRPVGLATFVLHKHTVYGQHLGVLAAERRDGIGRALVHRVLAEGRQAGAAAAVLGPTPDTIAFYRLIGFVLRGYVRDRSFYLPSR